MRPLSFLFAPLLLSVFVVCGCGSSDDSDVEPVPDISASYNFAARLQDNECISLDFWEVFAFANDNGNGLPIFSAELEQDGVALTAVLELPDCVLAGDVAAGGAFALAGSCHDDAMERALSLTGVAEVDGLGWAVGEGGLVIEVSLSGGDSDTEDCSVISDIEGSGN
ncbi:MAG TPA: hypothetical protein DIU15_01580 [Deltaproteobacteria bacterium]|nr:hypothetical protein [Deltaproteobacteria bacterium]HCP44715.1 hypothetical protein [Deltaproteobacteria bacterium]